VALPDLAVPTLVAYGEEDTLNRPLCEDLATKISHARLTSIPGAGHVANLDAPEEFNALLASFLDQQGC
jgi:3-oxoadipate enol-lactonase